MRIVATKPFAAPFNATDDDQNHQTGGGDGQDSRGGWGGVGGSGPRREHNRSDSGDGEGGQEGSGGSKEGKERIVDSDQSLVYQVSQCSLSQFYRILSPTPYTTTHNTGVKIPYFRTHRVTVAERVALQAR